MLKQKKGAQLQVAAKRILLLYMLQKYLDLVQESPGVALTDLHLNAIFLETARSHHISEHTAKSIFDAYQAAHPDDCKPTAHTIGT